MHEANRNSPDGIIEAIPAPMTSSTTTTPFLVPNRDDRTDILFLISIVSPLIFCCFAIFVCALNSIWKTRQKLRELNKSGRAEACEFTEYTVDLITKVDSCIEFSSAQASSREDSVLL